jgi:hypothetical protein
LIAHGELRNPFTERFDLSRKISSQNLPPGLPDAEHKPQWQPEPLHRVVEAAHFTVGFGRLRGAHSDEHFIILGDWFWHFTHV